MTVRAVVFDLDGTLVESAPGLQLSANRVLAAGGRRPLSLDEVKSMVGNGVPALVARAFAATGEKLDAVAHAEIVRRFERHYVTDCLTHTALNPGAAEVLAALAGDGLGVGLCTNKPQEATLALLEHLGIAGFFTSIVGGDMLDGIRKPDPRHVQAVLDALGAVPDYAVMIGDSPVDVAAGRNAGIKVVAVTFGYPLGPIEALGADKYIDHFDELRGLLRGL